MTHSRSRSVTFRFPTDEYRSLPFPRGTAGDAGRAKLATCFIRVEHLPDGLENWMKVNPRVPKLDTKHKLRGPVARAMVDTLCDEPDKFVLKNQGIYILAKEVAYQKEEGGRGVVKIALDDQNAHGLVNGGHTYLAIRQAREEREANGEGDQPWDAYVRLHLMEGIDQEDITELAEGLNRSMQVDDPSLENLKGSFASIKKELDGKPGADAVAYRQGDTGDIDVQQILSYMALFDLEQFPDRKSHPNKIFGHPKAVLQSFIADTDPENGDSQHVFDRILPKVHEILVLADRIQQEAVVRLGRLKVKSAKGDNRVRSARHRNRPPPFAAGTIDGLIHSVSRLSSHLGPPTLSPIKPLATSYLECVCSVNLGIRASYARQSGQGWAKNWCHLEGESSHRGNREGICGRGYPRRTSQRQRSLRSHQRQSTGHYRKANERSC
jgi:hypothetical protein